MDSLESGAQYPLVDRKDVNWEQTLGTSLSIEPVTHWQAPKYNPSIAVAFGVTMLMVLGWLH
jgi:hypothetical protein